VTKTGLIERRPFHYVNDNASRYFALAKMSIYSTAW
jgi:hypothetical protein